MIVLRANPEMEATFSRLIQTTGERVKWDGNFVVIGNYLILHGENRSLFFNFDNRKVVSNFIELTITEDEIADIADYPKVQNIINMLLYAFGKWGTVKGVKVEKSESELNLLFVTILREISVEPDYSRLKFRFRKDGILITYEDVIQLAIEEKENPLKEMEESEQEKEGLWHSLVWKGKKRKFTKIDITEEQRNGNRIGHNFYMVGYKCPKCSANLHMAVFPEAAPFYIETDEGQVRLSRVYTCTECGIFYTPRPELLLIEGDMFELDFEGDQKAYEDYRELLGSRAERTSNCHFNEFVDPGQQQKAVLTEMHRLMEDLDAEERQQQRAVLRNIAEEELSKLIQAIPTMNDLIFNRFNGIMEDGFYSDKAIKSHKREIDDNIQKRKKRRRKKEKEKQEKERLERERLEKEKAEKERLEREKAEKERLWREEVKKDKSEKDRSEKDRLDSDAFGRDKEEENTGREKRKKTGSDRAKDRMTQMEPEEIYADESEEGRRARVREEYEREMREEQRRREEDGAARHSQRTYGEFDYRAEEGADGTGREELEEERKQRYKKTFSNLKKKAEGALGKAYQVLNGVIKEIEAEDLPQEQKEKLLPALREERQIRGEEEVRDFMKGLAANMDRRQYQKLARRLKEYGDIDISVYQEKLDVQRAPVEREEIQKMVNETNLQDRDAIVELIKYLEDEDFSGKAVKPFMKKLNECLGAIDKKELDRLCDSYEDKDFVELAKLCQEISEGNFLPELKQNALDLLSKRLARIKIEECELLVKKLKNEMEDVISPNSRHHFYPARDILEEKEEPEDIGIIDYALDTYAANRHAFEYPILVVDTSRNRSGREGMILTPEHIFCSTLLNASYIPISKIKSIRVSNGLIGKGITVEKNDGTKMKVPFAVSNNELKQWGAVLTEFIKYLKEKPKSRHLQYLAKEKHDTICCYRCGFVYKDSDICPECGCKSNQ